MIVATPVTADGQSGHAWGKAHWIGVAEVVGGEITAWQVHEVGWDVAHDLGTHGSHHARVVRFLQEQRIEAVVVDHVGEGMYRMLTTMEIPILRASEGDAHESILAALSDAS